MNVQEWNALEETFVVACENAMAIRKLVKTEQVLSLPRDNVGTMHVNVAVAAKKLAQLEKELKAILEAYPA